MKIDTFANRLQKAMNAKNLKQVDLVNITKIDKTLINKYISGVAEAKQYNLSILSKALEVNEVWLMGYDIQKEPFKDSEVLVYHNMKDMPKKNNYIRLTDEDFKSRQNTRNKNKVPVLGKIPAGIPIEAIEDILDYEDISDDMAKSGKMYFGLKINGNSMYPKYIDGDVVIFESQSDCESGEDCAVMINGNDAVFKRIIKNENGILLQSINSEFESKFYSCNEIESLPVTVIGVATEIRRKV